MICVRVFDSTPDRAHFPLLLLLPFSQAVLARSAALPSDAIAIHGHDFDGPSSLDDVMASFLSTGLQASALGQAVIEVNRMLDWRVGAEEEVDGKGQQQGSAEAPTAEGGSSAPPCSSSDASSSTPPSPPGVGMASCPPPASPGPRPAPRTAAAARRAKIFVAYTSNLISAGVREQIRYLAQHGLVDVLVTTAGGVEEDVIKCLGSTYLGEYSLKGSELRVRGLNRAGNLLIPNDNYCAFEDWVMPILDACLAEQEADGDVNWTPSKLIERLGREIGSHPNCESSVLYWAARNGIPIYCPAITDGSLGDMLYFHSYRSAQRLRIDVVEDIRAMNDEALKAAPRKTGVLILGGGVPKHHVCNANLMRNGADFAVYMNTAQEFDGSDSGARPDEAVSWGKIRADAKPVKVHGDVSILLPLLMSQTFVKEKRRREEAGEALA